MTHPPSCGFTHSFYILILRSYIAQLFQTIFAIFRGFRNCSVPRRNLHIRKKHFGVFKIKKLVKTTLSLLQQTLES